MEATKKANKVCWPPEVAAGVDCAQEKRFSWRESCIFNGTESLKNILVVENILVAGQILENILVGNILVPENQI